MRFRSLLASLLLIFAVAASGTAVYACPFCSAVSLTFGQEIDSSDVAVIAKMIEMPPLSSDPTQNVTATITPAKFEIVDVLKGEERIGKDRKFGAMYFGADAVGKEFLVMGMNEKTSIVWATPIAITPAVKPYLKTALTLPKEGPERLAFFQDYLEGAEEMLARDAYDEFAKAPYAMVVGMKGQMNHDRLVEWIKDPKVSASHRRLYLTMLGICGNEKDAEMLEGMIKEESPNPKPGMDALIASYLKLKGPAGLPLIEDRFLKDKDAEYTETYAAIMALRFHGQEEKLIPKERLVQALAYMLDRPQLADLVIPDLSRWEDWKSMNRLVELFKTADEQSSWVRVPVVNYLRACPLPEAKKHLEELAKIDPESIERANSFFPFGGAATAPGTKPEGEKPADKPAPPADDKAPELSNIEVPDASKFTTEGDLNAVVAAAQPANPDTSQPEISAKAIESEQPTAPPAEVKPAAEEVKESPEPKGAEVPAAPKRTSAPQAEVDPSGVLGAVALVGLGLFLVMAAIIRGGQHVTTV